MDRKYTGDAASPVLPVITTVPCKVQDLFGEPYRIEDKSFGGIILREDRGRGWPSSSRLNSSHYVHPRN